MPDKKQFKTHKEWLQYYKEYRAKNRDRVRKYGRDYMRAVRALEKRGLKLSTLLVDANKKLDNT